MDIMTHKGNSISSSVLPKTLHIVWDESSGTDICYTIDDDFSELIVDAMRYAVEHGYVPKKSPDKIILKPIFTSFER